MYCFVQIPDKHLGKNPNVVLLQSKLMLLQSKLMHLNDINHSPSMTQDVIPALRRDKQSRMSNQRASFCVTANHLVMDVSPLVSQLSS